MTVRIPFSTVTRLTTNARTTSTILPWMITKKSPRSSSKSRVGSCSVSTTTRTCGKSSRTSTEKKNPYYIASARPTRPKPAKVYQRSTNGTLSTRDTQLEDSRQLSAADFKDSLTIGTNTESMRRGR